MLATHSRPSHWNEAYGGGESGASGNPFYDHNGGVARGGHKVTVRIKTTEPPASNSGYDNLPAGSAGLYDNLPGAAAAGSHETDEGLYDTVLYDTVPAVFGDAPGSHFYPAAGTGIAFDLNA